MVELDRAGIADGELNDDMIVVASDAEIVRPIHKVIFIMLGNRHEEVVLWHLEGLVRGVIPGVEVSLAIGGRLSPFGRNAGQRHIEPRFSIAKGHGWVSCVGHPAR